MNFKNIFGAFAIAAAGIFATATSSNAALTAIFDAESDLLGVPPIPTLTLDASAVDGGGFDTTSSAFVFAGGGDDNSVINFITSAPAVFTIGNVNPALGSSSPPTPYSTATVTLADASGTTVVDLLNAADIGKGFAVAAGAFTVTLNMVADLPSTSKGSFDFTISSVPLPAGLALLLGGLGILGWVGRRRQAIAA